MTSKNDQNIVKAYGGLLKFEDPTSQPVRERYKAMVYLAPGDQAKDIVTRWLDYVSDPEWLHPARAVSRDVIECGEFIIEYTPED